MKKLTTLAMACIFAISCLTSCSRAEDSGDNVTSSTTTPVTTVTTTTTVPDSVPESTTTTTAESIKETITTIEPSTSESETTTTKTSEKETSTPTTKTTKKAPEPTGNRVVLDVKNIQMLPELPCGSEITSLAIVLNYHGFNVSKTDLVNYLTYVEEPDAAGVWGNPYEVFIGNPMKGGYGCYADVLKKCVDNYFKSNNISNYKSSDRYSGETVYIEEIKKGNPVVVWLTKGLVNVEAGDHWKMSNGDLFFWTKDQQCMVIVGYDLDKRTFILCDPMNSNNTVEYSIDKVVEINNRVNGNSLIIRKKS